MHQKHFTSTSLFLFLTAAAVPLIAAGASDDDSVVELEPLIVDSAVMLRSPDELAQTVSILTDQQLHSRIEASLGETLSGSPGVASTYYGPGSSRPILRGLDGRNIQIVANGMSVVDVSSLSPDHAVSLEPAFAQRIEILRGPATLLYGNSAVGGVVNVVDHRMPVVLPERQFSGRTEFRHGTAADENTGLVDLTGAIGNAGWRFSFLRRKTGDVDIPGFAELEPDEHSTAGVLRNSAVETTAGSGGLTWFWNGGFTGASFAAFDTLYGVPGHGHHEEEEEEEGEHDEEDVRIDLKQRRWDVRSDWLTPSDLIQRVQIRAGYSDYRHTELEGDEIDTVFESEGAELRGELLHNAVAGFEGLVGVQLQQSDLEAIGEEAFVPSTRTRNGGLFLVEEVQQGPLSWQFGGRLERQTIDVTDGSGLSRSDNAFSTSVGGLFRLDDSWAVAASIARTGRIPTAQELFADGPHTGTSTFEVGDPDLGRERSTGFEVSLRKRQGTVTGSLTLFRNLIDDHIVLSPTGEERDELPVFEYRQQDARYSGAEFEAEWHLHEGPRHVLDLIFGADFVRATSISASSPLPRIPPFRTKVGVRYSDGRWSGGAELRYVAEQDRVAAFETATDGYTLLSAFVSYTIPVEYADLGLFLRGSNLTDEKARPHTSFLKDVAPLPGRDFRAGLRVSF